MSRKNFKAERPQPPAPIESESSSWGRPAETFTTSIFAFVTILNTKSWRSTAAQIPGIENRRYPPSLSGSLYPDGIPIYPEEKLEALILDEKIQQVIFAYSDISHITLMHIASRVLSRGADFWKKSAGPISAT
jgi:predicted GTPase